MKKKHKYTEEQLAKCCSMSRRGWQEWAKPSHSKHYIYLAVIEYIKDRDIDLENERMLKEKALLQRTEDENDR